MQTVGDPRRKRTLKAAMGPIPLRFTGREVPDLDAREVREPFRGTRDRRPGTWPPAASSEGEDGARAHGGLGAAPVPLDGDCMRMQARSEICMQEARVVVSR